MACRQLRLVGEADPWAADPTFLMELLVATYERRRSQREVVNEMPLYPTEGLLWDESQVGRGRGRGSAGVVLGVRRCSPRLGGAGVDGAVARARMVACMQGGVGLLGFGLAWVQVCEGLC